MKTILKRKTFAISFLILISGSLLCGCGSGKENKKDTAVTESVAKLETGIMNKDPLLEAWPDTAYASAADVKFKIERLDSISGELTLLDDLYSGAPGVFTFRGGEHRDADYGGSVDSVPTGFQVEWVFQTAQDNNETRFGTWRGGTGWTGQPLYVEWPDSVLERFKASGMTASRREILIGSLCGEVYSLDYDTGRPTRAAIPTGNPIKGTMSLDPTLNGNLYVGQGVPSQSEISALTISLFKNCITHSFGPDAKAPRYWHAYDSSAIRVGRFLFRPGENGTLYKWLIEGDKPILHSAVRYSVGGASPGMEASMAVSRNYGYIADNGGNIICFNLNTLQPVWHYKLPDDIDSTPVLCEESGKIFLYTGCEVEHPGVTNARYVKLDALTGNEIWINEIPAKRADVGSKHFDGGYYASTLPGRGDCKDLLFINVVNNEKRQNGSFIAIERTTGKIRYTVPLKYYAWSSPVGFMVSGEHQLVVTFDCAGRGYIINGVDGEVIAEQRIGANFESSPVVNGHSLVIGSRGDKIYRLSLR
ncbi:MAG: PQQ-like beta-propeller repeat protein [Bacteroidales bacterium]|nr:PQQ-like beta-propeller repeat protein [Bacteroidales bacterium]